MGKETEKSPQTLIQGDKLGSHVAFASIRVTFNRPLTGLS